MGFTEAPGWKVFEDKMVSKVRGGQDIISKVRIQALQGVVLRSLTFL